MSLFGLVQLGFDFFAPTPAPAAAPVLGDAGAAPEAPATRPAIGRAALRARTGVLFSRLQDLGLRGVDQLVLMRTRTVMVSLIGRTLRVHEGYAEAPESVLRARTVRASAVGLVERRFGMDCALDSRGLLTLYRCTVAPDRVPQP